MYDLTLNIKLSIDISIDNVQQMLYNNNCKEGKESPTKERKVQYNV